jgi:DNA-binding SARP family transcriptional activator
MGATSGSELRATGRFRIYTADQETFSITLGSDLGGEMDQGRRRVAGAVSVGLEWRALGPLEVIVDGCLVDLGPPTQRALFGLLLSRVDRPVALDALVEELWSGDPPAAAMASLRAYVSNLRRVLEPGRAPRAPAAVLRTRAPGYLLDSRGVEFDGHRFTDHVLAGRKALGQADPHRAVAEFDAALGLWRGEAYADMRDAAWAVSEVARLEKLRLSVVEGRCAALLQVGAHDVAAAELEAHVRAHPLREHGCELLALGLYRAGRQAEALGVLRDTRARLVEELGIDPGEALQRLEHDILTHASALDWRPLTATSTAPHPINPPVLTVSGPSALLSPPDELRVGGDQRVVSTQVQNFTEVVGREQELTTLRAAFTDPQRLPRPALRVLTGLGGVGKTTLARAYAQHYQEHYGLVWWVRAEDPDAVAGEFRALLEVLAPQYAQHTPDPIQAVHAVLANCIQRWLLVIDNIAEPDALRGLLPAAGPGDVLVTSRAGTWPDRRMVLAVQPLIQPDAMHLVSSLSGDPDQDSAAILAVELGGLPLALAQAGCYVAHSALDLTGYLALYRNRRAELHQQGHVPDYPDTVATTWQLTFDQLSSPARALLNLLAWYAPGAIPLDLLLAPDRGCLRLTDPINTALRPLVTDSLQRHRAVTELIAYGLLTRAGPRGSVTIHRLVQAVTADQLTATNHHTAWITAAATLLEAACPPMPPTSWPATRVSITTWQSLHTHLRVVIDHLHPDQPITLNLRFMLFHWTGQIGDFLRARELAVATTEDMTRVLGPNHTHTLWARSALAYWTGQTGDVVGARELAAVVLDDMTRVFGAAHWYTLFTLGNYGRWVALSGDFMRARELATAALKDMKRTLDADDPFMLLARAHLARWTGEAGDVAHARDLAAAAVEDTQRVLGPDDQRTLAARENLLRWTGEAGDPVGARELAAALVADDERMLGSEHRHTLLARAHLARWTGEVGDMIKAQELTAELIKDCKLALGPDHRYTLLVRAHLAQWIGETRK